MKDTIYEEAIFKDLTGRPVRKLWNIYCGVMENEDSDKSADAPLAIIQ